MNYAEMASNKFRMDSLGVRNELFVFEGNHNWPEPQHFERALASHNIVLDPDRVRQRESEAFCHFLRTGNPDAAWLTYANGMNTGNLPCRIETSVSDMESAFKKNLKREISYQMVYRDAMVTMSKAGNGAPIENIYPGWWKKQNQRLMKMHETGLVSADMLTRIQNFMVSNLYEIALNEIEFTGNYPSAQHFLLCLLALLPENPGVLWQLYLNSERMGDSRQANKYKLAAVEAGEKKGIDPETGVRLRPN
jgi:hypothetical protein